MYILYMYIQAQHYIALRNVCTSPPLQDICVLISLQETCVSSSQYINIHPPYERPLYAPPSKTDLCTYLPYKGTCVLMHLENYKSCVQTSSTNLPKSNLCAHLSTRGHCSFPYRRPAPTHGTQPPIGDLSTHL